MSAAGDILFRGSRRLEIWALVSAVIGVVGLVIGAFVDLERFFISYLVAYSYVLSIALGALVFLMICHAMRAGWPTLLRRLTEAIAGALPILAVLFIPLLFGLGRLYPWLHLEAIHGEHERALVEKKVAYLNGPFFIARACLYFVVWIGTWLLLTRLSRAQDRDPALPAASRMHALSAALLPPVALALSFASFDWLMSLMPTWYSTMFPVYWFAGGFVAALALLTVLTAAADSTGTIRGINPSHYYALGRLLLAFVIFWAYVGFFQLLLQWIANEPEEATFYIPRAHGGFGVESAVLAIAQFVVPFFALLLYELKRRRKPLATVAVLILVAHYVDAHWLVVPSIHPARAPIHVLDLAALLAVAGVTVAFAAWRTRGVALVPLHDPALARALRYDSA